MGAGAGAGQGGDERPRPAYLLEEDPEALWFGHLEYSDPVIGGDDGYHGRR